MSKFKPFASKVCSGPVSYLVDSAEVSGHLPPASAQHEPFSGQLVVLEKKIPAILPENPVWGNDGPLNLEDAAKLTGMAFSTFKQKVHQREIASLKLGKRRLVRPSAIRAYIEKHELPAL